jgi:hypothetical protein
MRQFLHENWSIKTEIQVLLGIFSWFYNMLLWPDPSTMKHSGHWDVKRKPLPVANAPPIDVFPAYDEQPGPRADDYIADPDYPADMSRRSSTCWVVAESEA